MKLLMEAGDNALTTIKSTGCITADIILKEAYDTTAALFKQTNITKKTHIDTQAEAKVEADDCNHVIQATIGTKEGAAEAVTSIVGSDVTNPVLKHTDGNPKEVNEYHLIKLFLVIASAAKRPTERKMVALNVNSLQFKLD